MANQSIQSLIQSFSNVPGYNPGNITAWDNPINLIAAVATVVAYNNQTTVFTPLTGATIVAVQGSDIVNPSGTIAALAIDMPANPNDGDIVRFYFSHIVSALTMATTDSSTIVGGLTVTTAGENAGYVYNASGTTWYRVN